MKCNNLWFTFEGVKHVPNPWTLKPYLNLGRVQLSVQCVYVTKAGNVLAICWLPAAVDRMAAFALLPVVI